MADVIQIPTTTYVGKQADEIFAKPVFTDPDITNLVRVIPNVKSRMQILIDNTLQKIVKKRTGCGRTPSGGVIQLGERFIDVEMMGVDLEECAANLDGTVLEQFLNSGNDLYNLDGTYIKTYLEGKVVDALKMDIPRIAFWGDTALANTDYNQTDGFIKQLNAYAVANPTMKKVDLAGAPTPANTIAEFKKLYDGQTLLLRAMPANRKRFIVSGERFDALLDAYDALTTNQGDVFLARTEASYPESVTYKGIQVQPYRYMSQAATDLNAVGSVKEIMILTDTQNLVIGTDRVSDMMTVEMMYHPYQRVNTIEAAFKMGTLVVYPDFTVYAQRTT